MLVFEERSANVLVVIDAAVIVSDRRIDWYMGKSYRNERDRWLLGKARVCRTVLLGRYAMRLRRPKSHGWETW